MTNPGILLDAIVAQLRAVPLLVAEMGGDAQRILPYYDEYPKYKDVTRAIALLPAPGILVVYEGTSQGGGRMQPWAHQFRLVVKLGEKQPTDTGAVHYAALYLLVEGIPTANPLNLLNMEINSSCDAMDVPRWQRQSLIVSAAGDSIDYFVVNWTLTEKSA